MNSEEQLNFPIRQTELLLTAVLHHVRFHGYLTNHILCVRFFAFCLYQRLFGVMFSFPHPICCQSENVSNAKRLRKFNEQKAEVDSNSSRGKFDKLMNEKTVRPLLLLYYKQQSITKQMFSLIFSGNPFRFHSIIASFRLSTLLICHVCVLANAVASLNFAPFYQIQYIHRKRTMETKIFAGNEHRERGDREKGENEDMEKNQNQKIVVMIRWKHCLLLERKSKYYFVYLISILKILIPSRKRPLNQKISRFIFFVNVRHLWMEQTFTLLFVQIGLP